VLAWSAPFPVVAQVVPDATLPSDSVVNVDGATFVIDGGTAANGNLFHSFEQFSVPTGGAVLFNSAVGIENIFSRVTGSSISEIDGVLGANGTANLFFLNPNGIVFGPNARLELGGSFVASTADSVVFDNGFEFSASNPQVESLLAVDMPMGLQFRDNPGSIVNRSVAEDSTGTSAGLQIQSGETLALVGGDIRFEGGAVSTIGGQVELGGILESGTLGFSENGTLLLPQDVLRGDVIFNNNSFVGGSPSLSSGASISIQGRNVQFENSAIGIVVNENLFPVGQDVSSISINATGQVNLNDSSILNQILSSASSERLGGNITVTASLLALENSSAISTNLRGQGSAGSIFIDVDSLTVSGGSVISSEIEEAGVGVGGNIDINSDIVSLQQGGQISTGVFSGESIFNTGGDIILNTQNLGITNLPINGEVFGTSGVFTNVQDDGVGNAGDIEINTGSLLLADGSRIAAGIGMNGVGVAGNIDITAQNIQVIGVNVANGVQSAIDTSINRGGTGEGGEVRINVSQMNVLEGGQILSASLGNGNAGSMSIEADNIFLSGGGTITTSTANFGSAGMLTISATGLIHLTGTRITIDNKLQLSSISTETQGLGNAGSLNITAREVLVENGAGIAARSIEGSAGSSGDLVIQAPDIIVRGERLGEAIEPIQENGSLQVAGVSGISTSVEPGSTGMGGNLTIQTERLLIQDGAGVTTSNFGPQRGGNLTINASELVSISGRIQSGNSGSSLQSATSAEGDAGNLAVTSENLLISDGGFMSSQTMGRGNAGGINIEIDRLFVENLGFISTETSSIGRAGNLTIRATESVELIGNSIDSVFQSGLFSRSSTNFPGVPAGNINITTEDLLIREGSEITVSGEGRGNVGSITVNADSIFLDSGEISSELDSGQLGGRRDIGITLRSQDLVLRDRSRITTNARNDATGGDINIDTGVLVGLENSDITTNADRGQAGEITVNALGVIGSQSRTRDELIDRLGDNLTVESPSDLLTSDITAIGVQDAELNGQVIFNTPDVDSTQGIVELPQVVVDPRELLSQNPCIRGTNSEFSDIGTGGFPAGPDEPPTRVGVEASWIEFDTDDRPESTTTPSSIEFLDRLQPIVPARGWRLDDTGRVTFTADDRETPLELPVSSTVFRRPDTACSPRFGSGP